MSHADSSTPFVAQDSARQRTIEQHREAVLSLAGELSTVTIRVDADAINRVLATDHVALNPIPPFDNSAMDGFLVHRADVDSTGTALLPVAGDVAAGDSPLTPPHGAAIRIMTGAPIDTSVEDLLIVPVENTNIAPGPQPLPDQVRIKDFDTHRLHIRSRGESLDVGERFAHRGQVIDVGLLTTLISAGIETVEVYTRPRVAIISTGNELQEHGGPLEIGKIPDSNSSMLAALVRTCGQIEVTIAHSSDTPENLRDLFTELAVHHDVIVTTGGVAVGVYDVVREVLFHHCAQSWFGRVKHKPGGHQGLSVWETNSGHKTPVVSLPGNPVAAFVSFHLYVRPLLARLSGAAYVPTSTDASSNAVRQKRILAQAAGPLPVPRDRDVLVPARIDFTQVPATVTPFNGRKVGSHMIGALIGVNGLLHLRNDLLTIKEGDMVEVLLIPSTTW